MLVSVLCTAYPLESGEVTAGSFSSVLSAYIFIARNDGFWQAPEFEFCYETEARKVMVDFKFDALYTSKSS